MKKIIIITLIVTLLAGSGAAFGGNNPVLDFAGINAGTTNTEENQGDETEEEDKSTQESVYSEERSDVAEAVHEALSGEEEVTPQDGEEFGQAVAERAQDPDIHLGEKVSEAARDAVYSEDDHGEERSDVAKAVHEALSGDEGITPHDGREFGEAVSGRARDDEINLGKEVSEAARNANESNNTEESKDTGNPEDSGKPEDTGQPENKGKPDHAGGPDSTNESGNSNRPGNSGNAGNSGSPGNSGGNGSPGGSNNAGGGGRP